MKLLIFLSFFTFSVRGQLISEEALNKITKPKIFKIIVKASSETKSITEVSTGFLINSSGVIITNFHGMKGFLEDKLTKIEISSVDGERYSKISVGKCGTDKLDLCLIKVTELAGKPYFNLKETQIGLGHQVSLIGHGEDCPRGNPGWRSLSGQIVKNDLKNEQLFAEANDSFREQNNLEVSLISTNLPFCKGDSGSPLFDSQGVVIGINTLVLKEAKSDGQRAFAISTKEIINFVKNSENSFTQIEDQRVFKNNPRNQFLKLNPKQLQK